MPHKYNADRRHHIPRARYKVTNWKAYEAGLRQRGSLTIWFSEEAVAAWQAAPRATPGGPARYPGRAGGAAAPAGWQGALLGPGGRDSADPQDSVSPAAAPDRGAGRFLARA